MLAQFRSVTFIIRFWLLIDPVDTKGNSTGQHTPFEFVDPSDLDCSLCMR